MDAFTDITERYSLVEGALEYCDAPIQGFLFEKRSGSCFAFRVIPLIEHQLWHWVLVNAAGPERQTVEEAFRASSAQKSSWVSIVEDRRSGVPTLTAERIVGQGPICYGYT